MATHSGVLAKEISRTKEPGGFPWRVGGAEGIAGYDLVTKQHQQCGGRANQESGNQNSSHGFTSV